MTDYAGEPPVFKLVAGGASDRGLVREHNEDAWLGSAKLFVVADGVGGHAAGDIASQAVVDAFRSIVDAELTSEVLHRCLDEARRTIVGLDAGGRAPGSTVVGAGLVTQRDAGYWLVFNIGDSRAYLMRGAELEQVSVDHSRVQELKDAGQPSDAVVGRNVITRAIGAGVQGPALADQWLVPAITGDRILLCSDGLTSEVSDQLIAATLLSYPDAQQAADELVRAALTAGGHDNVTAVVVDAVRIGIGPEGAQRGLVEQTLSDLTTEIPAPVNTLPGDADLWSHAPRRAEDR